jgi:hypothetical protein
MSNRVYFAVQAVGIAPESTVDYVTVHGGQSVGMTTTFNLEPVLELGQLEVYENIENIPDCEITIEKVLDGYPLLSHLATRGATNRTLAAMGTKKCNVALSIYDDSQSAASGTPVTQVSVSGMFLSSFSYTFPTDGNCTESVTLVGNNRTWKSSSFDFTPNEFDTTDSPLALASGWGGVQRRENVLFAPKVGGVQTDYTILPGGTNGIPGISSSGTNNLTGDVYGAHITSLSVSTDLGREAINELGRRGPYFRFINFPIDITTDIEVITTQGDQVSATEEGILGSGINLPEKRIRICTEEGTTIDLGSKNKLSNVQYGGGDTGGGQATVTYSYVTQNTCSITHPQDPG